MRRQAPNIWVSQRLFGHPGLDQDPRACVGKVLCTFAHIAPLCYASYPTKSIGAPSLHFPAAVLIRQSRYPTRRHALVPNIMD